MNPIAVKLAMVAIDQAVLWTAAYVKARDNPGMTDAEADELIQQTQETARTVSDGWRRSRAGNGGEP